jgi:ribosomal protein S17E
MMKKPTTTKTTLKFYCDIFGHNYQVSKKVTSHVNEYTCKCCKKQLTTNSNGYLTELTPKYKEINNLLEDFYNRRMLRLKNKSLVSSIY